MFSFEKERDIWDVEKLMQDVRELETEQIKAISNYLSAELCNKSYTPDLPLSHKASLLFCVAKYTLSNL